MLKGITRKIALLIAVITAASLLLTGCAKTPAASSPTPSASASAATATASSAPSITTSYKIGVNTWGSGVPVLDAFGDNAEYALKALGNTTQRASDDFTPETESNNVQNFCAAGVQGIALQAAGVTNLPQMAATCMTNKVPFVLFTFIGSDADRTKLADSNPYYVGCMDADMVTDGKEVADMAIADGCKTAVLIGGNIGDNNMDQRSQGFRDEFTAKGGTILAEARCTDASEAPAKAEDMLSAHKDAQCLYAMVGDYIPGSLSAIDTLGLKGKINVYMSCVDKTSAEYIKDGTIKAGNDGIMLASLIAPTLLQNYLDGHKILDADGKAPHLQNHPFKVDKTNVDAYMSVFTTTGVQPVTEDMLKSLCYRYNPDVTYKTYQDMMDNGLTLNAILKAHNLPTVG
jgi:ABC-type sugar transport system substrate-binding protein